MHKIIPLISIFLYFCGLSLGQKIDVNQKCLGCICEASSGCNVKRGCVDDTCGPFGIIKPYWEDAGSPTIDGVPSLSNSAYQKCTSDITCAAITVQGYMEAYKTDCNRDGQINCDDFALLHWYGGGSCTGKTLPAEEDFTQRYIGCKKNVKIFE